MKLLLALSLLALAADRPQKTAPAPRADPLDVNPWEPGKVPRWWEGGLHAGILGPVWGTPRSVLLVILDDVGFDDAANATVWPNLHALAARGVVWTRAMGNPVCSPARASLFSGRWRTAEAGEVCAAPSALTPADGTLALLEGFPGDVGLFGKWHVGANPTGGPWEGAPAVHGVDRWRGTPANLRGCGGAGYTAWLSTDGVSSLITTTYQPPAIRDEVLGWIGDSPGAQLVVWAPALAHGPRHAPPAGELPPGWPVPTTEREKFDAMGAEADRHLGQVLAALPDDWLVIVVGDNGTPLELVPNGRGKTTTWREGVHVPLVAAGPGIPQGYLAGKLVHVADLAPTVLEYVGAPVPPGLDGLSLLPLNVHPYVLVGTTGGAVPDVAAVSLTDKLRRVAGVESFYDLALDAAEQCDRIADPAYAARVAAARAWLDANLPPP